MSAHWFSKLTAGKMIPALCALLTAILCCLPHLMALMDLGGDYTPFAVQNTVSSVVYDESHAYAVGPSRFMRTGSLEPEADVYEMRSLHSAYPIFHTIVLGSIGRAFHSLEAAWIFADAIFPALSFLLLYHLFGFATSTKTLRAFLALACLIVPLAPRNFLLLGEFASIQPLDVTRTPNPELTLPLLLLSCYLTIRAIGKDSWTRILLAGICVGLNFYTYYFYTVAIVFVMGMVLGLALVLKKLPWKPLLLVSAIGALVALPAVYSAYLAMGEGAQQRLTDRMSFHSHAPVIPGLILLALSLLCAVYLFSKFRPDQFLDRNQQFLLICLFLLALLGAGGAGLNIHALTGVDHQHGHFYNKLINPAGAMLLSLIAACALESRAPGSRWLNVAGIAGVVAIFALAGFRQGRIAQFTEQAHRRSSPAVEVLEWTRDHAAPDAVLGTIDVEMLLLNPAISGRWNFVPIAIRSMATEDEIVKRYLIVASLLGMTQPEVELTLIEKTGDGPQAWRYNDALFHEPLTRTRSMVREKWPTVNLPEDLKTRKLDYLIAPLTANVCTALPRICPEDTVYANRLWKVIRMK